MEKQLIQKKWFKFLLCAVAFVGMTGLAIYQRKTGPTYPVRVDESLAGAAVSGKLVRSHPGEGGALVEVNAPDQEMTGEVAWRRFPTSNPWQRLPMIRNGEILQAELPHQPPAGKLEYSVHLVKGDAALEVPSRQTAVIRYRGDVPAYILVPHIICMFLALTVVLRTGLGLVFNEEHIERLIKWVVIFIVPGGLVLGPIVQKFAFGAYWTGWPFGEDWTDNKTAAAFLAWIVAWLIARYRPRFVRLAIAVAVVVMIAVYLIPHSANGSEIDWEKLDAEQEIHAVSPPE